MTKKKKIVLITLIAVAFVFLAGIAAIFISRESLEKTYEKEKSAQSLYDLCGYYTTMKNSEKIVELYPKLLFSGEYSFGDIEVASDEERMNVHDYMIFLYMNAYVREYESDELAERISDAFTYYESFDLAFYYTLQVINDYYEDTNDSKTVLNIYDLMVEKSDDANYKYAAYLDKYNFVAKTLGEAEKAKKEMKPELDRLFSECEKQLEAAK